MRDQKLLLGHLLRSSGMTNRLRFEKDAKKRGKTVGNLIGLGILLLTEAGMSFAYGFGFGKLGLTEAAPEIIALLMSLIAFLSVLLRTDGGIFCFRDTELLNSLPLTERTIVSARFWKMYVRLQPWLYGMSLPFLLGVLIGGRMSPLSVILWLILTAVLSLLPMVLAVCCSILILRLGSGRRNRTTVRTLLTFLLILFCFSLRFLLEKLFRDQKALEALDSSAELLQNISGAYFPAVWFGDAVSGSISSLCLLLAVSCGALLLLEWFVGKQYRRICSSLLNAGRSEKTREGRLRCRSLEQSIVFKEWKRMTGSVVYMTNMLIGQIVAVILVIALLFIDPEKMLAEITQGAPLGVRDILVAVPLLIHMLVNMSATTSCSYSLEGRNLWIPKSLPIEESALLKGKIRFNLILTVPFVLLGNIVLGLKNGAGIAELLLFAAEGVLLCGCASVGGMLTNMRHINTDWENETEVVKQGAAVPLYLFINMFGSMAMIVLSVILGMKIAPAAVLLGRIVLAAVLFLLLLAGLKRAAARAEKA